MRLLIPKILGDMQHHHAQQKEMEHAFMHLLVFSHSQILKIHFFINFLLTGVNGQQFRRTNNHLLISKNGNEWIPREAKHVIIIRMINGRETVKECVQWITRKQVGDRKQDKGETRRG